MPSEKKKPADKRHAKTKTLPADKLRKYADTLMRLAKDLRATPDRFSSSPGVFELDVENESNAKEAGRIMMTLIEGDDAGPWRELAALPFKSLGPEDVFYSVGLWLTKRKPEVFNDGWAVFRLPRDSKYVGEGGRKVFVIEQGKTYANACEVMAEFILKEVERRRPAGNDTGNLRGEEKALALLIKHPDWTDVQIAEAAGVNRTTVYDWLRYKQSHRALRSGRDGYKRGSKDKDTGQVEAIDGEDEDEEKA